MKTSGINNAYGMFSGDQKSNMYSSSRENALQRDTIHNLKKMASNIGKDAIDGKPVWQATSKNSTLNSMNSYTESLRAQRTKTKDATLSLKSLKYQYKSISSKIIRSKTSAAAKQAASQAGREVLRLKRERMKKGVDAEEVEAAIAHAKSMERIAKKKARHLLEEELAEASLSAKDKSCKDKLTDNTDIQTEDNQKITEQQEPADYSETQDYQDELQMQDMQIQESQMLKSQMQDMQIQESQMQDMQMSDMQNAEISESLNFTPEEQLIDFQSMMEDFDENMQDLMEDMGLDELSDSMLSVKNNITEEELKELKIKHRNKEMKDMVKADADYLKVVFDKFVPAIDVTL